MKPIIFLAILLMATQVMGASVSFKWTDSNPASAGVTSYKIYEGTSSIATVPVGTLTYTATTIVGEHSYNMTAVNATGESAKSNTVSTPAVATTPVNFTLSSAGGGSAVFSWTANAANQQITGYPVYVDGVLSTTVTASGATLTLPITAAHTIQISAKNAWGESAKTTAISIPATPIPLTSVTITLTP